jgi:GTPase SAR1 family protein
MAIPLLGPVIALAALAAAALGYRFGRDVWSWITRTRPPAAARARLRVLVAGPTGIGKTTLINRILGSDLGAAGEGEPMTPGVAWLGREGFPVWFADTKGIEIAAAAAQVDDLRRHLEAWDPAERPHVAWLCVQADAARVMDAAAAARGSVLGTEGELGRLLDAQGVPVLVVITQADLDGELRAQMERSCRAVFAYARAVVALCAEPRTRQGRVLVPSHGLAALRRETLALAPEALRAATARDWPEPGA